MKKGNKVFDQLIQTMQLLAADYQTQLKSLPSYVNIPDEVVSTFDEVFLLLPQLIQAGLLNDSQKASINSINYKLSEMNDRRNETEIWSLKAMQDDPDWEELRKIAKSALSSFGLSIASPRLDWIVYIQGKRPDI